MTNEEALKMAQQTLYDAYISVKNEDYYEDGKEYTHLVYYVIGYRNRGLSQPDMFMGKGQSWEECLEKLPVVLKR